MQESNKLNGLRGWLALLGLGVVVGPLRIIFFAFTSFSDIYAEGTWSFLTTEGSPVYNAFWAPVLIGEIAFNACLFILSVYAAYLFFTKKQNFPKVYIAILTLVLVTIPLDAWLASKVLPDEPLFDDDTIKELVRSAVAFIIWVPYLIRSKRVKATFIEPHNATKAWKTVGASTAVTLAIVLGLLINDTDYNELDSSYAAIDEETQDINSLLLAIANETNKDLPVMVDAETRLDSTLGASGEFAYKYTLVNLAFEEIDQDYFYETMQPILINSVCSTEEMGFFVEQAIPVKYLYYGKNGKQISSILITPDQCRMLPEPKLELQGDQNFI